MTAPNTACIILASGLSERFGAEDKLSANLCGQTVLSYVLNTARAVDFGEIFCVSQTDEISGVTPVRNQHPEYGQGHALRLGLKAARNSGWKRCVIMLGDMPLIASSHIENLIRKIDDKQCVVSLRESIRMPPAAFESTAIDLVLSLEPVAGAREIFDALNPATLELDADSALDVDTPADLARVARIMEARIK